MTSEVPGNIIDLKRKLSIVEKERDVLLALLTEVDKVFYEKLMNLESEVQVIQQGKLEFHEDFKKIYGFIREVQALKNRLSDREKVFNISIKKVEELTFQISETDRIKSEFLANTSHEIRTPLNAILGYMELIKGGLYDTPEEMQEFVNGAIESAGHLLKLLNDILDIARLESGILKTNFEEVNLKMLIEAIYTSTQMQAYQKEIEYNLDFPDENIIVRADADRLKQIFQNLISNALKFTPRGGTITVKVSFFPENNYALCEIIDTGIGILKENIKLIFDRFTQLDSGTTRKYQGAGLGLYITKSLIELMGGLINVKSKGKNEGAKFIFTLPLATSDFKFNLNNPLGKEKFKIDGESGNPLIAVILDDPNTRNLLTELLLKSGYKVVCANTADDGFSIIKELNPSLIVLDWALPRRKLFDLTNGINLYRLIKSHPEFSTLPLLILTGHTLDYVHLFDESINPEIENYFQKPLNREEFLNRVDLLLNRFGSQKKLVLLLESDPKVYNLLKQKFSSGNYALKIFYNSQDLINYFSKYLCSRAILILNQIAAGVLDDDIYRLVLEKITDPDFAIIVFSNSENYTISDNFKFISHDKTFPIMKKEFLDNPESINNILDRIK
jgi:signal transduction histidine kinase/CheY-like chemotaxis protein